MEDRPWGNEELKRLEEALPLEKAKTGVGCEGFHPKSLLGLDKRNKRRNREFSGEGEKVEQSCKWPQQASTTMFFLIPKNVTSERPIAIMPTLVRWWEAMMAPEVAKWQQKYRVDWTLLTGGMEETSKQCGKFCWIWKDVKAKQMLNLAKAFERVSLPVVWACATHFSFPKKVLRVLCGYFEHQRRVQFEGCAAEPFQTITAFLPGSTWTCLLLGIVLQDALRKVTKKIPPLKLRVFVDDITALLMGKNTELAEMAKKVMKKLKEEVDKRPQIVNH